MEVGVIARAQTDRIQGRINEAECRLAIGDRLLIGESQIAGPHGRGKAGAAVKIFGASGLIGANVKSEISIGRNIGAVAESL